MVGKPTGTSLLTRGFNDPALRAEWERKEQRSRKLALAKLDEIEKLYREMAEVDGLGLDPKRYAGSFDFKRFDTEALEPIIGRYLILQNILLVREVLMDGRRPWRDDFTNLRDRHERLVLALRPALKRGLSGLAGARRGHEQIHGTAEEKHQRWTKYQQAVDDLMNRNPRITYTCAIGRVASNFEVHPTTIKRRTKNPRPRK
jgi:hypothetical protein